MSQRLKKTENPPLTVAPEEKKETRDRNKRRLQRRDKLLSAFWRGKSETAEMTVVCDMTSSPQKSVVSFTNS